MTLAEFRAKDALVSGLRKALETPELRIALACVRDNGPAAEETPLGTDATAALIRLGRVEQHDKTIKMLTSLSNYPVDLNVDNDEMLLDPEPES